MISSSLVWMIGAIVVLMFVAIFAIVAGVIVFTFFRNRKSITSVDITDGIDAKEWSIIKDLFVRKEQQELEKTVKEKLVKVADKTV